MKKRGVKCGQIVVSGCLSFFCATAARAQATYELTVKNGSAMPISAGAVYAIQGEASDSEIGDTPSEGLVNLCQMGDPTLKISELKNNKKVAALSQTPGPFLPGQTVTVKVTVPDPESQSLHFVAMYGKSKELCSAVNISSGELGSLRPGDEIIQTDRVISAGAATEPVYHVSSATELCKDASDAISCLRLITMPRTTARQIHYFSGYLPSVLDYLEIKYGSDDVLTLLVPPSGAVNVNLKRL